MINSVFKFLPSCSNGIYILYIHNAPRSFTLLVLCYETFIYRFYFILYFGSTVCMHVFCLICSTVQYLLSLFACMISVHFAICILFLQNHYHNSKSPLCKTDKNQPYIMTLFLSCLAGIKKCHWKYILCASLCVLLILAVVGVLLWYFCKFICSCIK